MRLLHFTCVCSCFLAAVAAMIAAPAAAEPVQATPTADAVTTGLWLFQEGQGNTSAAVKGPAAVLRGATWAPGREGYALAMHSGYVAIPDDPAIRPDRAITVEVWAKLARCGGDLVCKNSVYMMRLGAGGVTWLIGVDGKWMTLNGRRTVPTGRWTHLALTYDSATRTAATYIDGVLDAKQQAPGQTPGLLSQGRAELRLGLNDWNPLGSEVDGKVAALRISNIARTFEPIVSAVSKPIPSGNLVPNGDFELGLLGWRLAGEGDTTLLWAPDSSGAASGRLCLRTVANSEGGTDLRSKESQSALVSRPVQANPGARYVLSARMRSDAPGRQASIAAIAAGGRGNGRGESFRQSLELATEWKPVSHSFTLPADWTAPSLCVRIDPPRNGHVWVDDVRLIAGDGPGELTLANKIGVGASAIRTGSLFFAGRSEQTTLSIVNSDTADHRVTVKTNILDFEGNHLLPVALGTFDLPAGGTKEVPFSIDTSRRGTFRLGFELTAEGQTWRQDAQLKYAVVVPLKGVGNAEESAFGMNTHMEREPSAHLEHSMEVLSQCGVKWIRAWWGWGMCEKERGTFDWTEYDRQFNPVVGAGMKIMPILLRYYPQYEQAWAGALTGIQRPPYKMEEWGAFVRKVAERYRGRVTAWELWNEPTMDNAGFTPQQYADLLKVTAVPLREIDPKAKIIGFAGVPLPFMKATLALGTASTMDVVSEHSYSQIELPEINLPKQTEAVRAILGVTGDKPIWHTEQGMIGDDDGYSPPAISEADIASLYTRNLVISRSLGIEKYFYFSAQTSPTYGMAVFYENYTPRPRLAALNACASFLEGTSFGKSYRPSTNTYAFLFQGAKPVCVAWNMSVPTRLSLPMPSASLQAFDLMGNTLPMLAEKDRVTVLIPTERPIYLCGGAGDYAALEKALAEARVADVDSVVVTARPASDGMRVTVTGASPMVQDGVVEMASPAGAKPADWPAAQHFNSLAAGEARSFTFALPAGASESRVRVRVGDREMQEVRASAGK